MRIPLRLQAAYVCLSLLAGAVCAQGLPPVVDDAFKRADIPWYGAGVFVQEVGGPVLLAANQDVPLNPASTMKLVTTNAALAMLGPAYTWKTQAYTNGARSGDALVGDLIFRGSGDPKFTADSLRQFLQRIRARGIREIRGNLLLDRSAFEDTPYDAASFDGDPLKPYNVGPDALLLNFKSLGLRFVPDETTGRVNLIMEPPLAGYAIGMPRLAGGECGDWRTRLAPSFGASSTRFEGAYAASCGERAWYVHPYEMTANQYFGAVFRRIWTDLGGVFTGTVKEGLAPQSASFVAEWESPPLAEVVRDINKYSNNVMARQLLLTLAHQVLKLPANTERGAAVVKLWLAQKGIDAPDLSIENGSGLSRSERISAATMGRLLGLAFQAPTMPEFISSMPLIGMDGTMRQRLRMQPVAGNGHVKTGTLTQVRAIAGYLQAVSGKRYAVVCLINHANAERSQEAIDTLLQWVYDAG
jgi:D-alanyl-D-alanine carboxypeptidase/D-alanyl-D-alanine-endopeptidase (penicillin-binding protein 4)